MQRWMLNVMLNQVSLDLEYLANDLCRIEGGNHKWRIQKDNIPDKGNARDVPMIV